MPTLTSKLNPRSEEFKANAAAMRAQVDDLNAKLAQIAQGKTEPLQVGEWFISPDTGGP